MLEVNQPWTSTGSSGGLTPVYVHFGVSESVLKIATSTLATTQSISLQSAQHSSGPWIIEGTASISTTHNSTAAAIRVTGPYGWVRPYFHTASTGTYSLQLIGVS